MRSALTMRPASTRGKIQRPSLRWPRALAVVFLVLFALTPTETAAQTPRPDDLRALLYYLDQNDQRAAEAELRRLRLQFPNWTPPTDLAELRALVQSAQTTVDERPIWAKIEQGDYAGARALIEQARTAVPGWTPNPEMIRLLDLNEGQAAFDAAIARRDAAAAIAAARRWPQIMRCDRINNAWQLAEMYRQIGDREAALATYRGTAATCTRRPDAIATLEKANEIATWPQMEELFAVARAAAPTNAEARANAAESFAWYARAGTAAVASVAKWQRELGRDAGTYAYGDALVDLDLSFMTFDYLESTGACIVGDPDRCIEVAKRYAAAGCDLLLCLVQPYKIPPDKVRQSIELLGTHVIPALRG